MTQFVIGIEKLTERENESVRKHFSDVGAWWNWIPGFWMVITREDMRPSKLRDDIRELVPNKNLIVVRAESTGWSGFGPATENRDMFSWIKRNWNSPD